MHLRFYSTVFRYLHPISLRKIHLYLHVHKRITECYKMSVCCCKIKDYFVHHVPFAVYLFNMQQGCFLFVLHSCVMILLYHYARDFNCECCCVFALQSALPSYFPTKVAPMLLARHVWSFPLSTLFFCSLLSSWVCPWLNAGKYFSWELCCHWSAINQLLGHDCLANSHTI